MITGTASRETIREINVEGTLNAFAAAAAAGARRFVYASSVAAYGFHPDNPIGMTEDWPTRPATRLFYAQEKAELERLLREQADAHPDARPVPAPPADRARAACGRRARTCCRNRSPRSPSARSSFANRLPVPIPVPTPDLPMQFIHEDDVGQALLQMRGGRRAARRVQHRRRRHRDRGRRGARARLHADHRPRRHRRRPPLAPLRRSRSPHSPRPPPSGSRRRATPRSWTRRRRQRELGWEPRYTGLEALRETLKRQCRGREYADDLTAEPGRHHDAGVERDVDRHIAAVGRVHLAPRSSPGRDRPRSGRRSPARPATAGAAADRRPARTGCSSRRGTADRLATSCERGQRVTLPHSTRSSNPASARFR